MGGKPSEKTRLRDRLRYQKDPLRNLKAKLKKLFGITIEQYFDLKKQSGDVCAICGEKESASPNVKTRKKIRELSLDHCHKTGKIRGLLCARCNAGLGSFRDCPLLLGKAIEYISRSLRNSA